LSFVLKENESYLNNILFYMLMGKIVGVISLKGGVGKTSSVISLAASLSSLGKKVLIIDGNFSLPNLGMHIKIIESDKTIHDVLEKTINIRDAIHETEWFDIIPGKMFRKTVINPMRLKDLVRPLKKEYDIILIDSSPALNEETLAAMLASDETLVIATPDCSTIYNTIKAINLAKRKGVKILGLVLNKVYNKKFEISLREIERTTNVPVMAVIPHDTRVMKSQSYFVPFVAHRPFSKGGIEYKKLASLLVGERYSPISDFFSLKKIYPEKQEINREIFYQSLFN
jgi:MinD-like ATPase involved in chromosome partitioning or flagellar assembly